MMHTWMDGNASRAQLEGRMMQRIGELERAIERLGTESRRSTGRERYAGRSIFESKIMSGIDVFKEGYPGGSRTWAKTFKVKMQTARVGVG